MLASNPSQQLESDFPSKGNPLSIQPKPIVL
jgi:hypothetical protein